MAGKLSGIGVGPGDSGLLTLKAKKLLEDNREKLDQLAKVLYEKETITGDEFMQILNEEGGGQK